MKNIIKKLEINDPVIPGTFWQITQSGKVLELRVTAHMERNPDHYRFGVIQIGRIIQKLKSYADCTRSTPQIQLFPNLNEKQLAATVYWPEFFSTHIQDSTPSHSTSEFQSALFKIARKHRFKTETHEIRDSAGKHTLVISILSCSNQPFIWLKTGTFIEELRMAAGSLSGDFARIVKLDMDTTGPFQSASGNYHFKQAEILCADS
ncbi:MAG: hypothetical protein GVY07_00320 [Bacteroidetes bacterium]|jgi:hypothetical protein|nr:hypothetical protein [Bacteroidota bacterium]